jgi:multidrug efflux pump subunit AcrB
MRVEVLDAEEIEEMRASPLMRTTNTDWGERVPSLRFALDQDRLQSIGLTSSGIAHQLQFLLGCIPITDLREDIRSVQVTARSAGTARLDPSKVAGGTFAGTVLTLAFLPTLYALWFKIKPAASDGRAPSSIPVESVAG